MTTFNDHNITLALSRADIAWNYSQDGKGIMVHFKKGDEFIPYTITKVSPIIEGS